MRMFLWTIAILMFGTSSSFAQPSPSFDCSKAVTEVEKLICSDEELAKLDVEINEAYKKFMATLDDEYNQNKLKNKQKTWLNNISKVICMNDDNIDNKKSCLKHVYEIRVKDLTSWAKRENYDFFMDYGDFVEAKDLVGFRKRIGKFVAKDGREYYIDCARHSIYPNFPENEKIYFYDWKGGMKYVTSNFEFIKQTEDYSFFACRSISIYKVDEPVLEFKDAFLEPFEEDKLYLFPEAVDNKAFDLEPHIREITGIYSEDKEKCSKFLEKLRESKIEIIKPLVIAKSFEELKDKTNINCTKNQFENIYTESEFEKKDYKPLPNFIWYDLDGKKIFFYNNFMPDFIANRMCLFNEETCSCEKNNFFSRSIDFVPLVKINNKYYFVNIDNHSESVRFSIFDEKKLSKGSVTESCNFKIKSKIFNNNSGEQ